MNYQYGTEARRLLDLDANQWTFTDLDSCGKLLMLPQQISNEERGELKKKLVIDPRIVQEVLGMTQPDTKGRKTGADGKKIHTARDPKTNTVLCINTAGAFFHNRKYYGPLQEHDSNTILDFTSLAWEYLQTKAFSEGKIGHSNRFSMQKLLTHAARPNGWIGANPVFYSADSRHRRDVEDGITGYYLVESGISIDSVDEDGQSVMDQYPESVFAARADFTGRIEAEDVIGRIKKRMRKRGIPVEEVELYIAACILEERPLHYPSRSIRDFVRQRMIAYGKCWDDTKVRLWFHSCYRIFLHAAAKEKRYLR